MGDYTVIIYDMPNLVLVRGLLKYRRARPETKFSCMQRHEAKKTNKQELLRITLRRHTNKALFSVYGTSVLVWKYVNKYDTRQLLYT